MPKSTSASNSVLALILNATAWANFADNAAASPNANLFVSLHTADPGVAGSQLTNETAYTNYARVAVLRTTAGWVAPASGASSNAALVQFATCGVTGSSVTHVAIGKSLAGAGLVLYAGALASTLAVALNIQPQFNIGDLDVTET